VVEDPLAGRGSPVQSGQAEIAAHLINKDEVFTCKTIREVAKLFAGLFVPFTSDETFFSEGGAELVSGGRSWTD
jgi:hypothetical protein